MCAVLLKVYNPECRNKEMNDYEQQLMFKRITQNSEIKLGYLLKRSGI